MDHGIGALGVSVGVLMIFASACGGGGVADGPARAVDAKPTMAQTSPQSKVPLAQRLIDKTHVAYGDTMVQVGGSVWVKTDNGELVRVDPASTRVSGRIQLDQKGLGQRYCEGIGSDGRSVWTCATNAKTTPIVRIDPVTAKVVQRYAVDKNFDQLYIPFAGGRMWVLTGDGSTLAGLRPGQGAPRTIALGIRCAQVAADGDDLVVTCPNEDTVRRIDLRSGKTVARRTLRRPDILSATGGSVWVGTTDGVEQLDGKTLARRALFRGIELEATGDIVATDKDVWLRVKGPFLYHVDPHTLRVTEQITADPDLSGGSLLVTDDDVWTTAYDDNLLFHLRR